MKRTLAILAIGASLTFTACGDESAKEKGDEVTEQTEQTTPETETAVATQPEVVDGVQVITVKVEDMGYTPSKIAFKAGMPAKIIFDQHAEYECASDVMSKDLGIALTKLPKAEKTEVTFTPDKAGTYQFTCGMDMLKGTVIVEEGTSQM
ncbi:MAG: cupredoxin domain-containing protein [Candidatus Kapaibacterium sp.]